MAMKAPYRHLGILLASLFIVMALGWFSDCTGQATSDRGSAAVKTDGIPAEKYEELPPPSSNPSSSGLRVRFLDVGQGDCALISCDGETMLIDGGPSYASSKVYAILKRLGIAHLDFIVVTHPDADHCGGVAGALRYASCGKFYCSTTAHDGKAFNGMLKSLWDTPVTIPVLNESFVLGGATVTFVGPVSDAGSDTNNGSLVCRIDYGSTSFLFAGDAELESETAMLSAGEPLDVDVLKVGHHGSGYSSGSDFLSAVSPRYAVISVGDNDYGHPAESTMRRLADAGATVFRTDEVGTVIVLSDGKVVSVTATKGEINE